MSWWRQFERLSCLCYLIIVLSVHWVCLFCSQIKTRGCIWLLFEIIYLDSCLNSYLTNLIIAIKYSIMFITWILIEVYQILLVSLFYVPVNNSGLTCYYQLQGFLFHLGLHLVFSINTRLAITNYRVTILIMEFNSHWNSVNMWLAIANYQDNNPYCGPHFVRSAYTHLPRYPLSSWLISHCMHFFLCSICGYHSNWLFKL